LAVVFGLLKELRGSNPISFIPDSRSNHFIIVSLTLL
jgi:hypothetical protein